MQNKLTISFRYIIAGLFIFSGVAKLEDISFFEKVLTKLDWEVFQYGNWSLQIYSRAVVALEIFLGLMILSNSYTRKFTLPALIGLLGIFTIHLFWQGFERGFTGENCGCYGKLLPMNVLESIIKNVVLLGMAGYLWKTWNKPNTKDWKTVVIFALSALLVTTLFSFKLTKYKSFPSQQLTVNNTEVTPTPDVSVVAIDSAQNTSTVKDSSATNITTSPKTTEDQGKNTPPVKGTEDKKTTPSKADKNTTSSSGTKDNTSSTSTTTTEPKPEDKPKQATQKSIYGQFTNFSNGVTANLDEGRKIICLFSLTCEHCQGAYKDLVALKKQGKLKNMYLLFYGGEEDVPYFFKQADGSDPYMLLDFDVFMPLLGESDFPKIIVQEDGKQLKMWDYDTYTTEKVNAYFK